MFYYSLKCHNTASKELQAHFYSNSAISIVTDIIILLNDKIQSDWLLNTQQYHVTIKSLCKWKSHGFKVFAHFIDYPVTLLYTAMSFTLCIDLTELIISLISLVFYCVSPQSILSTC